jgi:hypothetical protein
MPNRVGLWTMWVCEGCRKAALERLEFGSYVGAYQPDAAVYDTPCVFCGDTNERPEGIAGAAEISRGGST